MEKLQLALTKQIITKYRHNVIRCPDIEYQSHWQSSEVNREACPLTAYIKGTSTLKLPHGVERRTTAGEPAPEYDDE